MRASVTPLERVRFECASEVLCAQCQTVLDLHQPDPEQPDRLLGTCPDCGTWHLMDPQAGVMYRVPDLWARTGTEGPEG
jgi:hypothetical protein